MMSIEKKNVKEPCDSCDLAVTTLDVIQMRHSESIQCYRCEFFFVAKIIHPFWEVARHPSSALPIHLFPPSSVYAH